ncbi:hypothetical protein Dimus_017120 [Dionaea muscipula]
MPASRFHTAELAAQYVLDLAAAAALLTFAAVTGACEPKSEAFRPWLGDGEQRTERGRGGGESLWSRDGVSAVRHFAVRRCFTCVIARHSRWHLAAEPRLCASARRRANPRENHGR